MATRGFRWRFLSFTRPRAVLKRMRSPSRSTHTGVTCGAPSAPTVAMCANAFLPSRRSRKFWGIAAMMIVLSRVRVLRGLHELTAARLRHRAQRDQQPYDALLHQQRVLREGIGQPLARRLSGAGAA